MPRASGGIFFSGRLGNSPVFVIFLNCGVKRWSVVCSTNKVLTAYGFGVKTVFLPKNPYKFTSISRNLEKFGFGFSNFSPRKIKIK
jgi:hypothetical protein